MFHTDRQLADKDEDGMQVNGTFSFLPIKDLLGAGDRITNPFDAVTQTLIAD